MNKHLLVLATGVATLALTTAASAQSNKAYTDQQGLSGAAQSITINQSGSNGNVGFDGNRILQQGGGNNLAVNQSGDNNSVGGFDSKAFGQSSQVGNRNSLNIDQTGGKGNGVVFNQDGDNNGRRAASAPPADRSPRLFGAPVNYGVYPGSAWNYVRQSNGEANGANLSQTGDNNGLIVLQEGGIRNAARLIQTSAKGTTEAGGVNLAYFNQQGGIDSTIRLIQTNTADGKAAGNTDFNSADIRQFNGVGNTVARYSGDSAVGAARQEGRGLDLFSEQTGSYNQLSVNQVATNSRIEAVQNGNGSSVAQRNRIVVDQSGDKQNAVFQQYGSNNTATVTQTASLNESFAYQSGQDNILLSTQGGSGSHYLLATQIGIGNQITNTQMGLSQTASIDQNGNDNKAFNDQSGFKNTSTITQGQGGNTANVLQSGSNNTATVRQNR